MVDDAKEPPRIKRPMVVPDDAQLDADAELSDSATDDAVEFWHQRSLPRWTGLVDATTPEEKRE